jgi:large subunit ribosomal protein L18
MRNKKLSLLKKRQSRGHSKLAKIAGRIRLCVSRSNRGVYAQIIDDDRGMTLLGLSSSSLEIKKEAAGKSKTEVAAIIGKKIAQMALANNIKRIVFDRAGRRYHGRIKSLAQAARQAGLEF